MVKAGFPENAMSEQILVKVKNQPSKDLGGEKSREEDGVIQRP